MSSWECQVCKQTVSHGGVGFNYKIWHNKCFRCIECGLLLNSYSYRACDGKPYCLAHYRSDPTADDRGSFVLLPLAGMKRVLSDCQEVMRDVVQNLVFPVLPGIMAPPVRIGEGVIRLPQLFPQEEQTEEQGLGSEPKAEQETVPSRPQRTGATPINEPEKKNRVIVSMSAAGDKTMELAIGSICEEQVDVIVNSIGTSLDMKQGALAKAIRESAGPYIEKELVKQGGKPPAEAGSIIATKGYKLPCKHVLHVILNSWSEDEQCVQNLRQLVNRILLKADELTVRSIAFPLLGIGGLGYPRNTVVQVLYMEVTNYLESNVNSCLQKVVFSVPQDERQAIKTFRGLLIGETEGGEVPLENEQLEKYGTLITEYNKTRRGSMLVILPELWRLRVDSKQPYARFELNTSDAEYNEIVGLMSNRNGKEFTKLIYKIERIENHFLWLVYNAVKQGMVRTNPKGMQNERKLWHGTQLQSLEGIIASGFNRCYSGRALYGKGVYFAHNFSYSAQDAYSPPDSMGCKHIFLCRVLTGYFCKGHAGLREPPMNIKTHQQYNSAVDSLESPMVFVTFRDYTMYPEYLITLLQT